MSLGDHWQRQYEHMKAERDELQVLYRETQGLLLEAGENVERLRAEAWAEGYAYCVDTWDEPGPLFDANPYRESE